MSTAARARAPDRRRHAAADGLASIVRRAHARRFPLSARVPIARAAILACEPEIAVIVAALRSPRELPARGVDAAWGLLTDGSGPLYWQPSDLPAELRRVQALLGLGIRC